MQPADRRPSHEWLKRDGGVGKAARRAIGKPEIDRFVEHGAGKEGQRGVGIDCPVRERVRSSDSDGDGTGGTAKLSFIHQRPHLAPRTRLSPGLGGDRQQRARYLGRETAEEGRLGRDIPGQERCQPQGDAVARGTVAHTDTVRRAGRTQCPIADGVPNYGPVGRGCRSLSVGGIVRKSHTDRACLPACRCQQCVRVLCRTASAALCPEATALFTVFLTGSVAVGVGHAGTG